MALCVSIWLGQMAVSVLWLKVFTMGPLEWLLRGLTYGQLPPLLKRDVSVPALARKLRLHRHISAGNINGLRL